jgi:hypothetical protein
MTYVNSVPNITENNVCSECAKMHAVAIAVAWCSQSTDAIKKFSLDPSREL